MRLSFKRCFIGLALVAALGSGAAHAQGGDPKLMLELNALQPTDRGCRFTFVVQNGLSNNISKAAFELVLFDKNGLVDRLTIVDFLDLSQGKTKVRQFDFNDTDCDEIGRVLINNATECAGDGIDPAACIRQLETTSRYDITFGS